MKLLGTSLVALAVWMGCAGPARADETPRLVWFSGAARAISHSTSASRDVGLFSVQFFPYSGGGAGVDVAALAINSGGWSLRYGLFSLLEVQSADRWGVTTTGIWRGLAGGSMAVSADAWAASALGEGGKIEATVSIRHESEHESETSTIPGGTPKAITGNFVMPDLATRVPIGSVDLELRAQAKLFIPVGGFAPTLEGTELVHDTLYSFGPGGDIILRWRAHEAIHPFWSTFFEYLRGIDDVGALVVPTWPETEYERAIVSVPDQYLLRSQLGAILPFEYDPRWRAFAGDLQLFTFAEVGHGEGVLKFREEVRWGLGARGVVFR